MPSKKTIFTPLSILFRPHQKPVTWTGLWWRRRVPPPGPLRLFHRRFIAIDASISLNIVFFLKNSSRCWITYSPYAASCWLRKICNSFIAAWLAIRTSLYLMAKWFTAVLNFNTSNLQKAIMEEKIWFDCDNTRLVGDLAKLAFCLIDLWYTSICHRFW